MTIRPPRTSVQATLCLRFTHQPSNSPTKVDERLLIWLDDFMQKPKNQRIFQGNYIEFQKLKNQRKFQNEFHEMYSWAKAQPAWLPTVKGVAAHPRQHNDYVAGCSKGPPQRSETGSMCIRKIDKNRAFAHPAKFLKRFAHPIAPNCCFRKTGSIDTMGVAQF